MRPVKEDQNPYTVLGIERDATLEQIADAYRIGRLVAPHSNPSMLLRIEAAFHILEDPEQRGLVNKKLDQQQILDALSSKAIVRPTLRTSAGASHRKLATLAVLLLALVVSLFLAFGDKGAVCPNCEHSSISANELPDGQVISTCNCGDCNFSYIYDADADVDEHETDEVQQVRVIE